MPFSATLGTLPAAAERRLRASDSRRTQGTLPRTAATMGPQVTPKIRWRETLMRVQMRRIWGRMEGESRRIALVNSADMRGLRSPAGVMIARPISMVRRAPEG